MDKLAPSSKNRKIVDDPTGQKKTLRLVEKGSESGPFRTSFADRQSRGDGDSSPSYARREEVKAIKERYLKKKQEKKEADRLARQERQKIISETK